MNLDEAQRKKVGDWIAQGLKLSDIQDRLMSELGLRMTYMEVRLLVDDLKLTPKDIERPKTTGGVLEASAAAKTSTPGAPAPAARPAAPGQKPGGVSLSVDQVARPGAVVSGTVTFSDGKKADWYFDEMGRLGLVPEQSGYRPPPTDLQQFQVALQSELSRMGF